MVVFAGFFKTIEEDGFIRQWSVGFEALSWEDAESIAEAMNISELGILLETYNLQGEPLGAVPHFASWHYRNGTFVDEEYV
ncbi:MAG: hypothetical protein ACXABY_02115 [Candidatus Thorarchaeota archaeon]|jgi:hypothetical protein